ncbi:hypothetical protein IVA78_01740 [Bradyrhizobium sp. 137]|uniref:hypothetical protein n=1 Tax=Bradyrhizobium sp. 137 TaxID=2782614 RepID=UPI001FFA1AD5|nr:hypothetical protein [Bradyrhizobium sp. 137]MCK1753979.1 hypothetical protein [Bradyrhizobium sp. 137]
MLRTSGLKASPMRLLGIAAATALMLSAGTARRAEALTLINPATSPATKAAADDLVMQVRHGGGHGGHGGGFHGGGFRGGGFHGGGGHIGGFRGGGFRGGHIGGFRAAPAFHSHIGGYRYGGVRYGGYGGYHRHWGYHRPYYGYRHFHRRYYYGGYYPYYHYPRRCRIIWTYYGPRRVCRWPRWHYPYRYW